MAEWISIGAEVTKLQGGSSDLPCLVRENSSHGQHWVFARVDKRISEGTSIEVHAAVRLLGADGMRLRLDVGGAETRNGHFQANSSQEWVEGLDTFEALTDDLGVTTIKASFRSGVNADYLNIGLMLARGERVYNYRGSDCAFVIYSVRANISDSKVETDSASHSRHEPFGRMAHRLCRGKGVEIGALHRPFDLDAEVIYLDYEKTATLKQHYKNDRRVGDIRQIQIVWRGNTYPFFDDNAFDFVINSHVLEHVCNPGRTIEEWLRIVRPGGIVYMVVPDKDYTFDRPRALTPTVHLMEEFVANTELISIDHYSDYIRNREGAITENVDSVIAESHRKQSSIHVHTFTAQSLREFMDLLQRELRFEIAHFEPQGMHIHVALRKL